MQRRNVVIYGLALALSVIGHAVLFEGLGRAARNAPLPKSRTLEIAVITNPSPTPEPQKPPPPPKPQPKPVDLTKLAKLPPPQTPPPANSNEPEPAAETARPVFGVTMSSVVGPGSGSGFSVRVGNTLMKEPEKELTPPEQVKRYAPVPLHKVTKLPRRIGECEAPEELKHQGIDGKVKLEVEVQSDGQVGEIVVTSGLTPEINTAVVSTLKRCRFMPAEVNGQPVATRITYTYSFYLED